MTFFDDLGLKAAEQLEASLGPYVALASYKRMLSARRPTRTKAALGVVRCAAALADAGELEQAIAVAAKEADELREADEKDALDAFVSAASAVALVVARTNGRAALELARTLHWRAPTAARAYLVARLEDDAGTRALDAWIDATRLAASEVSAEAPDGVRREASRALYRAALCRWIELVLSAPERASDAGVRAEILARALEVDVEDAPPAQRLLIARARLLSASKFQRASGLSLLVDLSRSSNEGARRHAVLACAHHADAAARLEPIEQERVVAALRNWSVESERDNALARNTLRAAIDGLSRPSVEEVEGVLDRVASTATELAPQVRRLRALLHDPADGPPSGAATAEPLEVSLGSLAIDAILALRAGRAADAARALERATASAASATSAPASVPAALTLALGAKDVAPRRAAAALAHALFRRRVGAPREGWAALGVALARAGFFVEARDLLEEAVRLKEPSAAQWAGEIERRLAYLAFAKGDRAGALDGLRRAAALLSRGAPEDPRG